MTDRENWDDTYRNQIRKFLVKKLTSDVPVVKEMGLLALRRYDALERVAKAARDLADWERDEMPEHLWVPLESAIDRLDEEGGVNRTYPTLKQVHELDALPEQSVIVNVDRDDSVLDAYDVLQKITDNSWGGHGFIYTQTTQELVDRYPTGFYVVFNPEVVDELPEEGS
jgi:hypothetical protein